MAGRKSDFTLTKLDDLFSTQEQRDEEKLSKIRDIPLTEIDDFPDHPFKVRDDEDMAQLIESIKERGVITPATVRQKEDGRYELISGHRRKRACELAGFDTLRCEVVELNRDEATILMVESNYQRSQILPSEKAYAYKMRLEALSRQGKRTDLTSDPVGWKSSGKETAQLIGEQSGDSQTQVRRYIRLTNLVPELLEYGNWLVREIEQPEGFVLDETSYEVKISEVAQVIEVEIVNEYVHGNIKLTKVDEDYPDNKLTGATFEVYKDVNGDGKLDDADELIGTLSETSTGIYEMKELLYGKYLVRETKAPDGFELDKGVFTETISREDIPVLFLPCRIFVRSF